MMVKIMEADVVCRLDENQRLKARTQDLKRIYDTLWSQVTQLESENANLRNDILRFQDENDKLKRRAK
jgi:predicted nuclease with TOPRIM domain